MKIFTMTYGRSGTSYLSQLMGANVEQAIVSHELNSPDDWGIMSPDVSVMQRYNHYGVDLVVDFFWKRKNNIINDALVRLDKEHWIETNHQLAKAGLMDARDDESKVIVLTRDPVDVAMSMLSRSDYKNMAISWLYYLDPRYPKNRTPVPDMSKEEDRIVWYIKEMQARMREALDQERVVRARLEDLNTEDGVRKLLSDLSLPCPENVTFPQPSNVGVKRFAPAAKAYFSDKLCDLE